MGRCGGNLCVLRLDTPWLCTDSEVFRDMSEYAGGLEHIEQYSGSVDKE